VIGIIALLISILMPSLGRARASANLVACQSNFRQAFTAIQMYANEYKGTLPAFSDDRTNPDGMYAYTWGNLTKILGGTYEDPYKDQLSPVFLCNEANTDFAQCWLPNLVRTMMLHPRAFPGKDQINADLANKTNLWPYRKMSSIRSAAEKIAAYEGQQMASWNMSAEMEGSALDGWRSSYGHMYREEIPQGDSNYWDNDRRNAPIDTGANRDGGWFESYVRFRHMKNTAGPVVYFDGHVEVKKPGEILAREIRISN
jgi:prepilin-type processing-associated H-X9-DG protein